MQHEADPREVPRRCRQAAVSQSADDMRRVYALDAVHDTNDSDTIIVEREAVGTSVTTGEFTLPNIIVLTPYNGQIARLRDHVNILAAAAAMGRET